MKPQSVNHVEDRTVRIATFEVDKINSLPTLLKPYVALVEAVQKMGGEVNVSYGSTVEIVIPKNRKQLQETLDRERREWDYQSERYEKVQQGEWIKSYYESGVTEWAKKEGLPEPVFTPEPKEASTD